MKRIVLIFVLTTLVLSACATQSVFSEVNSGLGGASGSPAPMYDSGNQPMTLELLPSSEQVVFADQSKAYDAAANAVVTQQRMVIQNADLSIVVKDPQAKLEAIIAMAGQMGGFVVSSNMSQIQSPRGQRVPEIAVTIRVPVEKLDEALKQIKSDAIEIQNENRSGQDVTDQYTDLKSRLKNYEAAERELTELMKNAQKSEDVVAIFQQLAYYREQIEVTKGQMQYFEESAALSAISMRLIAEESIQPLEVAGWKPQGVARDAIQDLIYFLQDFTDGLIRFFLYGFWVLLISLLTIAIPIWLVIKIILWLIRRGKAKKAAPVEPVENKATQEEEKKE